MRWGWGWEWDERENPERREFYSNSKTKVSKNLFTTNYLINLNLNLKSGKNRPKKWQEQDKIIWKKFSTKLSESKNFSPIFRI
jgi:predicted PolB exonuclease-like 3'-5' exonuclease